MFLLCVTEGQTVVLLPRSPSTSKTYFPINVDNLEEEYRVRSADDGKLFREEYNVSFLFISCWLHMVIKGKKTKLKMCHWEITDSFVILFPSSLLALFGSREVNVVCSVETLLSEHADFVLWKLSPDNQLT